MFSSTQNTLPTPTVLCAPISPPISSTSRLLTTRPMPVPSVALASCPRRLKGWNSWASFSGVRPVPVSRKLMRVRVPTSRQDTSTPPPTRLYLMAFDSRLMNTCFTRVRSALTKNGPSNAGNCRWMCPPCACGSIMASQSASTSASDIASWDSESLPDSISARSRISLISSSRYQPACRIWSMLAFWLGVGLGAPDSTSCAKPRIAFSGERSSWLMLDRKSDLARFACSAANLALSSSTLVSCRAWSRNLRSVMSRAAANTPCSVRSRS